MDMSLIKLWEIVKDREAWRAAVHGATKHQIWLNDEQQMYCIIVRTQCSPCNLLTHPVHHRILTYPGIYQRKLVVPHTPDLAPPLIPQVFPAWVCSLQHRTRSSRDTPRGPPGDALSCAGTVRRKSEPQKASHWTHAQCISASISS